MSGLHTIADTLTNAEKYKACADTVRRNFENTGKGIAQDELRILHGHDRKVIAACIEKGLIVSIKGKSGGCYPQGYVHEKQERDESLREKAFTLLETMLNAPDSTVSSFKDQIESLMFARIMETETRSKARQAKE